MPSRDEVEMKALSQTEEQLERELPLSCEVIVSEESVIGPGDYLLGDKRYHISLWMGYKDSLYAIKEGILNTRMQQYPSD